MKLSALQIGFGVSVLTHGMVFSAASLLHAYHRNAGAANAGESPRLEFVLPAEPAPASASTVAAEPARRESLAPENLPQVSSAPEPPAAERPRPAPSAQQIDEPDPPAADIATPAQTVPEPSVSAAELISSSFLEAMDPVPTAEARSSATATRSTGLPSIAADSNSSGPAYLFNPRPAYPAQARARNEVGKVILSVLVNAQGFPEQVEVRESSGVALLDQAALEAVKSWRFTPARVQERPTASRVEVPVNFELKR